MFRNIRRSSGQSMVEFALALPLLALLLSGIAAFGFLLYAHVQVANATREAARAGSLYLGARFHYTYKAASGGDCWALRQWVEDALVERTRRSSGCPNGVNTAIHSFGLLNPSECTGPTSGADCWWLSLGTETGTPPSGTFADVSDTNTTALPISGNQIKADVTYRFNVPFFGSIFQVNPIPVRKSVIMRVQNN